MIAHASAMCMRTVSTEANMHRSENFAITHKCMYRQTGITLLTHSEGKVYFCCLTTVHSNYFIYNHLG